MSTSRNRLGIKKSKKKKRSVKKSSSRKPKKTSKPKIIKTPAELRAAALTKGDLDTESYQSPSSIETFLNCPKKWEFAYVKGLRMPPGIAMQEGSAHHHALHHNNKHKIEHGVDVRETEMVEVFSESLKSRTKHMDKELWDGETFHTVQVRGVEIVENYLTEFAPKFRPKRAEQAFRDESIVPGVRMGGFIDVETSTMVADYKVTKRAKSVRDVETSVQLGIYGAAKRKRSVALISLSKQTRKTTIAKGKALAPKAVAAIIKSVQAAIKTATFPMCSPTNFLCNPTYCGYWQLCRGKYGG